MYYKDFRRWQKFWIDLFGWDMIELPGSAGGKEEGAENPTLIVATGPSYYDYEGLVPGHMNIMATHTDEETVPDIEELSSDAELRAKVVELIAEAGEAVNLEDAKVIVTGGRGIGSEENLGLCKELAEVLGGAVGGTRPVIENGWLPRVQQVGQSGKIVAPELYIACGVSGATQHISGMSGSKYIIAINKDEEAPIFSIADLGIVGDVKKILPLMIEEFRKKKA